MQYKLPRPKLLFALRVLTTMAFVFMYSELFAQSDNCKIAPKSFSSGEELTYTISYNWFVVFADVGEVVLSVNKSTIYGRDALHFSGKGKSNSWWDKFFEVRDTYETWVDPNTLRPIYFQRNIKEGTFRQHVSYVFDASDTIAYSKYRVNDDALKMDTLIIPTCTFDVMSGLLRARNIDLTNIKVGDKFPVEILLDRDLYDLYFRYQGTEDIKIKGVGTFNCAKFTVLLVEGTIFHGGEDLTVWVTNDKNLIPVYAESPILIGNVRVKLTAIKGNKYPLTSKVKD